MTLTGLAGFSLAQEMPKCAVRPKETSPTTSTKEKLASDELTNSTADRLPDGRTRQLTM